MNKYILKRLFHLVIILLGVSLLTFLLMYIAPGDPVERALTAQGIAVSKEVIEAAREDLGLNRPFSVQYADWFFSALKGNLGISYKDGLPVTHKLISALGRTAVLTAISLLLALAVSLPLSICTAVHKDGFCDYIVRFLSFIGNSLPNFLLSVLLMYFFCIRMKILPVIANGSVKGLFLPCIALAIPQCSRFVRQFRAEILEQLGREYVIGAKTRGVKKQYYLINDVIHNSSVSIITIIALSIGTLLGGSVVIETIFSWPGLGKLAMDAITARDYPIIQGFVLLTSTIYVLVNLITDLCYHLIDPRVKEE